MPSSSSPSTTRRITGAVAGFGANFFLWMTDLLASNVGVSWLRDALNPRLQ